MSVTTSAVSSVVEAARGVFSKRIPPESMTVSDIRGILEGLGKVTVAQVGLAKKAEEVREATLM